MRGPVQPKCQPYFPHFQGARQVGKAESHEAQSFRIKSSQHQISAGMELEKVTFLIQ